MAEIVLLTKLITEIATKCACVCVFDCIIHVRGETAHAAHMKFDLNREANKFADQEVL